MEHREAFMREAIAQALKGLHGHNGGPFGAVIVKDGNIISKAYNQVTATNDPTAHAEVVAIRDACKQLNTFQLEGCEIYTSCEPCPMCLGAIYWARLDRLYYACSKDDAASAGFDDAFIYQELDLKLDQRSIPFKPLLREEALILFEDWNNKSDKTLY